MPIKIRCVPLAKSAGRFASPIVLRARPVEPNVSDGASGFRPCQDDLSNLRPVWRESTGGLNKVSPIALIGNALLQILYVFGSVKQLQTREHFVEDPGNPVPRCKAGQNQIPANLDKSGVARDRRGANIELQLSVEF